MVAIRITKRQAKGFGFPEGLDPKKKGVPTDGLTAEKKLFLAACKAHDLPPPVDEYKFHPYRRWKFDWLFDGWLALEIEGGMFGIGKPCPKCGRRAVAGHTSIVRLKGDIEKYREALCLGYAVIRCLPEEVLNGSIFPLIKRCLAAEGEQA